MKQTRFFAVLVITASMMFLFSSCNSEGDKKTTENSMDTAAVKPMEPPPPAKPGNFLLIKHKVASYAKWQPVFDANDSIKLANGLTNFIVGRGTGADSNMLLVAFKMADTAKAKALASSEGLKNRMQKSGVIGKPSFIYLETIMLDTSTDPTTTRVMVTHKVKDWDAWKAEFDKHKQARMDAGLLDRAVGHSVDDTHMVTLVFGITDMAKAKAFMGSKDLKDKMTAAGVEGPPAIFYYTVAKKY